MDAKEEHTFLDMKLALVSLCGQSENCSPLAAIISSNALSWRVRKCAHMADIIVVIAS